ncbi:MAG: hypothetical protein R2830_06085 [Saprospiraceae bacterium]
MKNRPFIIAMLALLTLPLFAQQKLTAEQIAIKQVIEDETKYFYANNYDQWAACVAHDDMTYFSYTSPYHGEGGIFEGQGWEAVAANAKKIMARQKPSDNPPAKNDYKFKVTGNIAYVTFTEGDGIAETRVLEKQNGQWKILRMEATESKAFKNFHQLYALQRMAGTWKTDMVTLKQEGGGSWTDLSMSVDFKSTPTGLMYTTKDSYKNENGELRTSEGQGMVTLNMENGVLGWYQANHYPYSNWGEAAQGTGRINEDGSLTLTGTPVGGNAQITVNIKMDGGVIHYASDTVVDGKKVYASTYDMMRTDVAVEAGKP